MIANATSFMDRIRPSERIIRWLLRTLYAMGIVALVIALCRPFFTIGINLDHSLPGHVFLIHKGETPHRGDIAAFSFQGFRPYFEPGTIFVKIIVGIPGDEVRVVRSDGCLDYKVFAANHAKDIGCAKPFSRDGRPLEPGPVGRVPLGRYVVAGTHPDSLDSRYAAVGWIRAAQLIGKAYTIF